MSEDQTITWVLELDTSKLVDHSREMERVLFRALALAQRLGLPEDIDAAITKIQRLVMTVRLLHGALLAVEAATPYGWAMALMSIMGTSLTVAEMTHETMQEVQGH